VKTDSPGGAKAFVAYETALNCLPLAYKQNKNSYCILKFIKRWASCSSSEYRYNRAA